jgi:uncharacterized protein (DUF1015 family)
VPRFEPFAGLRYQPDRVTLDDVVAPPYDVISEEDHVALEARSPYNSVRLELPRDDPPDDRYRAAHYLLDAWRADGILRRDHEAAFYAYRMIFTDDAGQPLQTLGVIGALGLERPGEGDILPHERTMPKPKGDRLDLLRATQANLSPIWGLSLASGLSDLIPAAGQGGAPGAAGAGAAAARATDADGAVHELWPVTDPSTVAAIAASVGSAPVVIADGHHRFETAIAYQEERRAADGNDNAGDYDLMMALIVELADDQLSVRAIHRLINGLPDGFDVVEALASAFDMVETDPPDQAIGPRMVAAGSLALVTPEGTWLARPRPELDAKTPDGLDSSRLDNALAGLPPLQLTYQHGWDRAGAEVAKGTAQAAVLLRPASIAQIAATGGGGERMPPKTTFFWPKLRTGLVFREVSG